MAPQDFTALKHKVEQSTILSDAEKKDWLVLLPKMTPEQSKELDRLLSIKMPNSQSPVHSSQSPLVQSPEESGKDLPEADSTRKAVDNQKREMVDGQKKEGSKPSRLSQLPSTTFQLETQAEASRPRNDISKIQSLTLEDLRHAPSAYLFFEDLLSLMQALVGGRKSSAQELFQSFEQSPLYKSYLREGLQKLEGKSEGLALSQAEFEAIADFRSALKKILAFS